MYGGRAIDSFDRRILTVYMDEYFGDFLFYTFRQFHFFRNKDVDYKIPPTGPKNVYVGQQLFSYFSNSLTHKKGRGEIFCHHLMLYAVNVLQMRLKPCHWQTHQRLWVSIPTRR